MGSGKFEGFDRVSDVLNPFNGYGKIDPAVLQNAADRGSSVHQAIHCFLSDLGSWEDRHDTNGYLLSFEKFWTDYQSPIIDMEKRIFNDDLKLTGAFDLIIDVGPDRVLIDWKTSSAPQKTWPLQGAAYTLLANQSGFEVDSCWFVKLDSKGREPKIFSYTETYEESIKRFLSCLDIYRTFFKDQKIPSFED